MESIRSITRCSSWVVALAILLVALPAPAANICDPTTGTQCAKVDSTGVMHVIDGKSTVATYNASSSALVTTSAYTMQLESESGRGMRVYRICVGVTNATAAAGVTVTVNRRSTASSGGTQLTQEGTGADAIVKLDPNDSSWSGVARRTPTLGTIGPTVDQWGFAIGELGAGTNDHPSQAVYCRDYGQWGLKPITVLAGTANGLSVSVSSLGAGGLAFGSISVMFAGE